MKTELETKIAEAIKDTAPKTKQRNKALASVRWVLKEACGLYVNVCREGNTVLGDFNEALIFDGRDNEKLKLKFFSAITGGKFTIELLP